MGRIESWGARPDRHYGKTELGRFKFSEGSDGRVVWRTDPTTGRIVRLTDRDLRSTAGPSGISCSTPAQASPFSTARSPPRPAWR